MSLFKRIKTIIESNLNYKEEKSDINLDEYEDLYYSDSKDIPKDNKEEKYYKILEVEYGAGFNEIKSSYRRLLKKYHPDLFQNDKEKLEKAKKITTQINEAYTYFERKYL